MANKSSKRVRRVADLLQRELAAIFLTELRDPHLQSLTLTAVEVSQDLSQAKVFYITSQEKDREIVARALVKAIGHLRHLLAQRTELRYVPNLTFTYDKSIAEANYITDILKKVLEDDSQPKDK